MVQLDCINHEIMTNVAKTASNFMAEYELQKKLERQKRNREMVEQTIKLNDSLDKMLNQDHRYTRVPRSICGLRNSEHIAIALALYNTRNDDGISNLTYEQIQAAIGSHSNDLIGSAIHNPVFKRLTGIEVHKEWVGPEAYRYHNFYTFKKVPYSDTIKLKRSFFEIKDRQTRGDLFRIAANCQESTMTYTGDLHQLALKCRMSDKQMEKIVNRCSYVSRSGNTFIVEPTFFLHKMITFSYKDRVAKLINLWIEAQGFNPITINYTLDDRFLWAIFVNAEESLLGVYKALCARQLKRQPKHISYVCAMLNAQYKVKKRRQPEELFVFPTEPLTKEQIEEETRRIRERNERLQREEEEREALEAAREAEMKATCVVKRPFDPYEIVPGVYSIYKLI